MDLKKSNKCTFIFLHFTILSCPITPLTKCNDVVVDELLSNKGILYDPDIVDRFIQFLSKRFTLQAARI